MISGTFFGETTVEVTGVAVRKTGRITLVVRCGESPANSATAMPTELLSLKQKRTRMSGDLLIERL